MQAKTLICPNAPCAALLARLPDDLPGPQASFIAAHGLEIPFAIEAPFAIRPDLVKLADGPMLVQDGLWHEWMADKRKAVCAGQAPLMDCELDGARWETLVGELTQTLSRLAPSGPIGADAAFPWLGGVRAKTAEEFFCALTMSIQEDFALMVPDDSGRLIARALSVVFPSGWDPKEKLGMPLHAIHAPVADNQALQRASPSMEQAMLTKGPFVRYVWTISGSNALKRAVGEDTLAHAQTVHDLWYRCERQVTVPIGGMACLFLIRVFVAPLMQVVDSPSRMKILKAALLSMSSQMLDYKGIQRAARIVLESRHV